MDFTPQANALMSVRDPEHYRGEGEKAIAPATELFAW